METLRLTLKLTRFGAWLPVVLLCGCMARTSLEGGDELTPSESTLKTSDVSFDVALRDTGAATIHARVYENLDGAPAGVNVLAVHDWTATGYVWEPLARAMFTDKVLGHAIKRVIAIDAVGHGDSSFPSSVPSDRKFGGLAIQDGASVLVQAIDALRMQGLAPRAVLAHGLGGLELQAAQQTLLESGSSLAAHGVKSAILLAPTPPQMQPWHTPFEDVAQDGLPGFVATDPTLGAHLPIPTAGAPERGLFYLGYTTNRGQLVSGTPTTDEALAADYFGPEPFVVTAQLMAKLPGPAVMAGVLGPRHGTRTAIVSFSEDIVVPAADVEALYAYLTGDTRGQHYVPIVAKDAVHNLLVSNPAELVDTLREQAW